MHTNLPPRSSIVSYSKQSGGVSGPRGTHWLSKLEQNLGHRRELINHRVAWHENIMKPLLVTQVAGHVHPGNWKDTIFLSSWVCTTSHILD